MVRMVIDRPFFLLVNPKLRVPFVAGEQDVPAEYASHWYVLANGSVIDDVAEAPVAEAEAAGEDEGNEAPDADDVPAAPDQEADDVPPPPAEEAPTDERAALIAEAEAAGVTIDKRWGIDRIKAALAGAQG